MTGCYSSNHQNAQVYSPQEVIAHGDVLLNRTITVRGTARASLRVFCTLMACPAENPCCNTCGAALQLCDAAACITLSGEETGRQVGCSGNECDLTCSPLQQGMESQVVGIWRQRDFGGNVLELIRIQNKAPFSN
jgi:hypothetical protein